MRRARAILRALALSAAILVASAPGAAPREVPGLLRLAAPPLVLHHAPEQSALAASLAARGPGEVTRIALTLGIPVPDRIDVYLVPTREGDPALLGLPGAPDWAAGYALVDRPEIVLRSTQTHGPTGNDAATVFTHELVHSLVSQAVGARRHEEMPAWFVEGLASHLAYEWRLVHSAHVSGLALSGTSVPLRRLEHRFPADSGRAQLAYLESFAFLQWLTDRSGEDALRRLLDRFRAGDSFDDAFRHAFGAPWSELEDEWLPGFLLTHRWLPILTSSATLWALVVGLFVAGAVMKRRRNQAMLRQWEEEERLLWPEEHPFIAAAEPGADEPPDASDAGAEPEPEPEESPVSGAPERPR